MKNLVKVNVDFKVDVRARAQSERVFRRVVRASSIWTGEDDTGAYIKSGVCTAQHTRGHYSRLFMCRQERRASDHFQKQKTFLRRT